MGATILIVEDDPGILHLVQDILQGEGWDAVGAAHPNDALQAAHRHRPAVILIDVMLPGKSGIEVAEELRAHGFADTPMVAMSASSIMRELAMHTGMFQATMTKPFELDRLCKLVRDLASHGRERAGARTA